MGKNLKSVPRDIAWLLGERVCARGSAPVRLSDAETADQLLTEAGWGADSRQMEDLRSSFPALAVA